MKYTEKDLAKNLTEPMDFDEEIISQLKKEGNKDILESFTKQGRAKNNCRNARLFAFIFH